MLCVIDQFHYIPKKLLRQVRIGDFYQNSVDEY